MNRRVASLMVIVAVFAGLAVALPRFVSLDLLVRYEVLLRGLIRQYPLQAWCVGFGVYFLTSLIPGTSGKSVICGWVFGFWQALIMVDLALTAAALVMFFAARYALSDFVEIRLAAFLRWVQSHLDREGPFYLLLLRLAHVPFTFVNYSCGALAVRTRTFTWTTVCGLLPGSAIFVFAGTQLPTLGEMQREGLVGLLDPHLWATLVLTAVLPVVIRLVARRWRVPGSVGRDSCIT